MEKPLSEYKWAVFPLPRGAKSARVQWKNAHNTTDWGAISTPVNIGIIMGEPSGIVDIDLDHAFARALGKYVAEKLHLPAWGRGGIVSHIVVPIDPPYPPTKRFMMENRPTVESRSTGHYALGPDSLHPSGEMIEWIYRPDPNAISQRPGHWALQLAFALHVGVLIHDYWVAGARNTLAFGLAGYLRKLGIGYDIVEAIIHAIALTTNDSEIHDRINVARRTFNKPIEDIAGYDMLKTVLDESILHVIDKSARASIGVENDDEGDDNDESEYDFVTRVVAPIIKYDGALWYAWNNQWHSYDSPVPVVARVVNELGQIQNRARVLNARTFHKYISMAQMHPNVVIRPGAFDKNTNIIGLPDGHVFDILHGNIRKATANDMITRFVTTFPDFEHEPTFTNTLIEYQLEHFSTQFWYLLGRIILGRPWRGMLITYGPGGTGKTIFWHEIIQKSLGDYATTWPIDVLSLTPRVSVEYYAWLAYANRVVVISELPPGFNVNTSLVKAITGGGRITARAPYGKPLQFVPTWTMVIETNFRPRITDIDSAIWDRMYPIPFMKHIQNSPVFTQNVHEVIDSERSRIIGKLLRMAYHVHKYNVQVQKFDDLDEWREDSSPLEQWLREHVEYDPDAFISRADLFNEWQTWLTITGTKSGRYNSKMSFYDALRDRFSEKVVRGVRGFSIKIKSAGIHINM